MTDRNKPATDDAGDLPLLSAILPIRNEARYITRSLNAVLAQDYPSDRIEIIVVDGMSDDGSREIVWSIQALNPNVQLIDNPRLIVPTGMNAAMARARGEIFVRIDGHCEIERDYFRRCVEHLQNDGVDGVGGPVETVGETELAGIIAAAMSSRFGVGDSAFRTVKDRTMLADTVAFPAYTRSIVERVGPYDEELVRNQDDDYNYRLRKIGAKVLLAVDVRSRYYSRDTIRSLWRQYFQYGYWKVRVMQKHPRQMQPRQFVPFLFVAALLLSLLATPFSAIGAWAFGLTGGSYIITNLATSFLVARQQNMPLSWPLPVIFSTLHVSYGLGFLIGLVKFWNRWGDTENRYSIFPTLPAEGAE